jgi:hypothetical protein
MAAFQLVFDELIQVVEVDVGEELAVEVADGQTLIMWPSSLPVQPEPTPCCGKPTGVSCELQVESGCAVAGVDRIGFARVHHAAAFGLDREGDGANQKGVFQVTQVVMQEQARRGTGKKQRA